MFNNAAYFGISSPTYGTFTMGRQSALSSDLVGNYDALSGSNAWSMLTFEGASGGGGDTENRIYDNSYEYRLNIGPVRLAAEAQLRNGGNSGTNNAFEGNIGFDYMGLSMDFVGGKIYDAVSVGTTLTSGQVNAITGTQVGTVANPFGGAIPCSLGCLSGTVSDNTVFQIAARYTLGPWKFYGGYEHVAYENPNSPLAPGAFAAGGYNLGIVNNNAFIDNKNLNIFWVGVKYSITPTLDIAGAYYGQRFGFFTTGFGPGAGGNSVFASIPGGTSGAAAQQAVCAANSAAATNCAGGQDMISVAIDWRFAKHVDMYAGVAWNQKFGGAASGFILSTNNGTLSGAAVKDHVSTFDPGIGLRYQF
jgi:predicted porin